MKFRRFPFDYFVVFTCYGASLRSSYVLGAWFAAILWAITAIFCAYMIAATRWNYLRIVLKNNDRSARNLQWQREVRRQIILIFSTAFASLVIGYGLTAFVFSVWPPPLQCMFQHDSPNHLQSPANPTNGPEGFSVLQHPGGEYFPLDSQPILADRLPDEPNSCPTPPYLGPGNETDSRRSRLPEIIAADLQQASIPRGVWRTTMFAQFVVGIRPELFTPDSSR
jgi:hypothetical protein